MRGLALAELGQWQEALTSQKEGHAAYAATGAVLGREWSVAQIARAYGQGGQIEEGLQVMDEALTFQEGSEVRFGEAEIYRVKGELLWLQASQQQAGMDTRHREREAEEWFLKAITVARRQQAESPELRAATSLARLWQQQGKKAEAHKLLSEIYNWFTEGFDTKDLQEAKALLEELH